MYQKQKTRVFSLQIKNFQGTLSELFDSIQQATTKPSIETSPRAARNVQPLNEIDTFYSPSRSTTQRTHRSIPKLRKKSTVFQLDSYLYSRKTIHTPLTIRSKNTRLNEFEQQYSDSIHNGDLQKAIENLLNMMVIVVEQDNIIMLITFLRLTALTFISFQEWTRALLFFHHCIFLSEFIRAYDVIQWVYLQIGFVCKYIKKYELAKKFIKKSLEFAWFLRNTDQEIICYEELGKMCFLNYELKIAKSLHTKSMKGVIEKDKSAMKSVSLKAMQQMIKSLPTNEEKLGLKIFSKAVNFPVKIQECIDQGYYFQRQVKNEFLISHNLECIPNQRIIEIDSTLEEMLLLCQKGEAFVFEIPIPLSVSEEYDNQQNQQPKTKLEQLRSRQMQTLIKLQSYKSVQPEIINVNNYQKKLPLEEMIRQRLEMKFETPNYQNFKSSKLQSNLEIIRLTHEKEGIKMNLEHQKKGLLRYAQKLLNQQQINF